MTLIVVNIFKTKNYAVFIVVLFYSNPSNRLLLHDLQVESCSYLEDEEIPKRNPKLGLKMI